MNKNNAVGGWGPDRRVFTGENPPSYVVFNSIINNKRIGDERNFVRIREAGIGVYVDKMKLQPGKQYEISTYIHNNARGRLNRSGLGVAKGVKLKFRVPSVLKPGENGAIRSIITASNADPKIVWDGVLISSDIPVALRYVARSAVINSNGAVNGQILPSSVFSDGASIGYDALNGEWPGCAEYSGFVTYTIAVDAPNFVIRNQVRKKGQTAWHDKIIAKPGDEVDFLITYQNTGTTAQRNVVIKDALPIGMTHVSGSVRLASSDASVWRSASDAVFSNGANIGEYSPRRNAFIKFSAMINSRQEKSGVVELVNYATAITANGNKQASATVIIDAP